MLVKAIVYILNTDTDFQAVVGQNKALTKYKAYAGICPQPEQSPYSVVRLSNKLPVNCKGSRAETFNGAVAVHCYHKNYDDVVTLANAIINALDGKNGTFNGYRFQRVNYNDMADGDYNSEFHVFQRVIIFDFTGNEDTAT